MFLTAFLTVIALLIATIYLFFKYKHSYWSRKNVPFPPPSIPFGHMQGIRRREHSGLTLAKLYHAMKGKGPFCGLYFFHSPALLAVDIKFIKNVLIKDFSSFQERGVFYNEKDDPLSAHLFAVDGPRWKPLRAKLTPTFTTGKMKFMFPTIVKVAAEFQKCLSSMIDKDEDLEMKELLARFTTDVIGTCAFGIECNSLKDPNAQFRAMGKKVFGAPRNSAAKQLFMITFRHLARKLHMVTHHDDVTEFFLRIVRETIELREKDNVRRNDFMDLLIEIKNRGSLDGTAVEKVTLEEIAAQAFVFFLAGFETSSTTLSYVLYELSLNKDIQKKGREEIRTVLEKHNGEFTYEAMMEMHYIDRIITESLRKYPPVANLIRMATKSYHIPEFNVTIDPETLIMIPVYGIHHDPEFYPDPEKFDPNRFAPDVAKTIPSCSFLPFGEGPRNCIGLRFGMMQARIGLVTLLRNFEFELSPKTPVPLKFKASSSALLTVDGELFVKFSKIEHKNQENDSLPTL